MPGRKDDSVRRDICGPIINVPAGLSFGVLTGLSFMGTAFSEPKLIKLASGFEAVTNARQTPQFLSKLPFARPDNEQRKIHGTKSERDTRLIHQL